jgi:hypothetical protein
LQFTFDLSPFLGQSCFCDCCSFAAREVSFCCGDDVDGLDVEGLVLEELLDEGDGAAAEGVVCVCACAAQARNRARPAASALLVRIFTALS